MGMVKREMCEYQERRRRQEDDAEDKINKIR